MLAGFFMLCEWILGAPITPEEVTFRHRKPADVSAYREVFRCAIRYGQPINSILFPAAILDRPVPSANEELAVMLDEMAARSLASRFASRFSSRVRDALISQLPKFLGFSVESDGPLRSLWEIGTAIALGSINVASFAIGATTLAVILLLKGSKRLPGVLVAVEEPRSERLPPRSKTQSARQARVSSEDGGSLARAPAHGARGRIPSRAGVAYTGTTPARGSP